LKEGALDRTMWRARFGKGFGPVVRQTTKWINEYLTINQTITINSKCNLQPWWRFPLQVPPLATHLLKTLSEVDCKFLSCQ
jgi:hypothetical protein